MKNKSIKRILGTMATLLISMIIIQGSVYAQDAAAPERSLEGTWLVRTTPRNCATGIPIPIAAFDALMTFHKGGTMSAWFQNATITTTRSPSQGLWQREAGWSDYSFKFVHLRYSLTSGAFIGRQEGRGTLILSESGDEFTTDGSTTGFDVNGDPQFTGCSNSVGTRFKLEL